MPAKAKVTKEMIIDAAFAVARETGAENINARTVSERLNCSTQPVMYHFATIEEPHLFRFLFQSDFFSGSTLLELIDAEELTPVLSAMQGALGVDMEQTKSIFLTVFLFAHGYASIIANNSLEYDEDIINYHLQQAYRGAILAAQEKMS